MKKETKSKGAPKEHKQPWQEKYATPEDIKRMLADRVMLRYNEVRGRTEIHWLSQGPTIREDEQGLLTIFAEDGGVTDWQVIAIHIHLIHLFSETLRVPRTYTRYAINFKILVYEVYVY